MKNIDSYIIYLDQSLKDALKKIDANSRGFLIVIDSNDKVVGTLTDGDCRRHLSNTGSLSDAVQKFCNTNFAYAHDILGARDILNNKSGYLFVPIVDYNFIIKDIDFRERMDFVPLVTPDLSGNENKYLMECVSSGWVSSQGFYISEFQNSFESYTKNKNALAVSNGTHSLHLALLTLNIGPGDEVIVPNLTFAAVINAVIYCGATPVIADVDMQTGNLSVETIREVLSTRTKAVIFVHLYGNPSGVVETNNFCRSNNLYLIEDCAEALGSYAQNTHVGNFGHISTYSFFGNKTITTGEGGMICFESIEMKDKASILRDHGMSKEKRYWHSVVGYNYRMTNVQAALGLAQMERVIHFVERKIENQKIYKQKHPKEHFSFRHVNEDCVHSNWFVFINLINYGPKTTKQIQEILKQRNIDSRRAFYCLSEMDIYSEYVKYDKTTYRNSQALSTSGLCLPSGVSLTEDQIDYVCNVLQLANQNISIEENKND